MHNGGDFLQVALDDLRAQTMGDFELLISDNASSDDTEEICRAAAAEDPRIRFVRQRENIGAAANYNAVFHGTTGAYFRWASHDDGCAPTHLESCLAVFTAEEPDVVLVYPRTLLIDEHGDTIEEYDDRLAMDSASARDRLVTLARNWRLCNPVMGLMRRDAAARTRLIDTFRTSDLVFLAELALQGRVLEVPQPLFHRRIHSGSAMQGGTTDAATWLDPSAHPGRRSESTLPVLGEVLRSVHRLAPPDERRSIELAVASAWVTRRVRVQGGRAKLWIRSLRTPSDA